MEKIVIYDTETTNSTIWGSIIEVGAVVVDKNLKEIGKLNKFIQDDYRAKLTKLEK